MHSSILKKRTRIAAMLCLVLGVASSAWAGGRWKVNDVVVCFGSGTCKVVRPAAAPETTFLDLLNDVPSTQSNPNLLNPTSQGVTNPGDTNGIAINNTLHLLVTDAGVGGGQANVVEYQIAGSDPSGNAVAHGVATVFNSGTQAVVGGIQAVALDKSGNMFILNANGSDPFIAKLNQTGGPVGTPIHLATQCTPTVTQVASMDLSADGSSAYVTSGSGGTIGTIRKVNLSTGDCTTFADFGSGVNLFGIKDIPPNALPTSATSCNGNPCPASETILVVAKGFVDIDTGETEQTEPVGNPDAVNVCTNTTGGTAESCALLLSTATSTPPLSGAVWQAAHSYGTIEVGNTTILDAFLHGETVFSPGKSGSDEPAWTHILNAVVRDNAVVWTNRGGWTGLTTYAQNAKVGDTNQHLWQATSLSGASGPVTPPFTSNEGPSSSLTDGLVWTDTLSSTCPAGFSPAACSDDWMANIKYCFTNDNPVCQHEPVFRDTATGEVWVATPPAVGATTGGVSGSSRPSFYTGTVPNSPTADNAVVWTNQGQQSWIPNSPYNSTGVTVIDPSGKVQEVTTTGMSGPAATGGPPNTPFLGWNETPSLTTTDGLQWQDQGTSPSVVARYRVTNPTTQTSLQALALNPLIRDCTTATNCSSSLPSPKVSNFWLADSASGNFFKLDFAGASTLFSTTIPGSPPCTACSGIQSIGIYGAEDAAQPGLTQLPSASLITPSSNGTNITNTAPFDFNPNPPASLGNNDDNQLKVTGYNFPSDFTSGLALTVYASPIDPASGFSDKLSTPTPPPNPPKVVDPTPCSVATSTGQCVVWQLDNNELPNPNCAPASTCPFLWVKLDFFNTTIRNATDFNNVHGVLDEQYDATASPDTGFPKVKCQLSQHTVTPTVQGATNCTYVNPLSPSSLSPPACFTKSRTNIPVKFSCADLDGKTLADVLPFLHVFQVLPFTCTSGCNEASFQPLQGTGGTVNYRFTSGQWNFNLNNLGFGYTPSATQAKYEACTYDANGIVEPFCTTFFVKKSCP